MPSIEDALGRSIDTLTGEVGERLGRLAVPVTIGSFVAVGPDHQHTKGIVLGIDADTAKVLVVRCARRGRSWEVRADWLTIASLDESLTVSPAEATKDRTQLIRQLGAVLAERHGKPGSGQLSPVEREYCAWIHYLTGAAA